MQIIKSVLCVTLLLAMLSYYIGPKRTLTDTFVGFDSFITL